MATKVIIVPRGKTKFKLQNSIYCIHCGFTWHGHFGMDCPIRTKTIQIRTKPVKSTCVKFQPQVEKELLRLGIKHALLAEMKLQGLLATRLEEILKMTSTKHVLYVAIKWGETRTPGNGKTKGDFWGNLWKYKARN